MSPRAGGGIVQVPSSQARTRDSAGWPVPAALIALLIIPMVAGTLRVLEVAGGPQVLPDNPRISDSPAPLIIHVAAAGVFALLGAFQFAARMRRRHRTWHRRAGRVVVVAGLLVAASGLWMTLYYSQAPGGIALWAVRLLVGSSTAASLVLGLAAIRRRNITAHRAWMIRAYALSVGAGTQTFTEGIAEALLGANDTGKLVGSTAGWVINVAVAEWIIRRPAPRRGRPAGAAQPAPVVAVRG